MIVHLDKLTNDLCEEVGLDKAYLHKYNKKTSSLSADVNAIIVHFLLNLHYSYREVGVILGMCEYNIERFAEIYQTRINSGDDDYRALVYRFKLKSSSYVEDYFDKCHQNLLVIPNDFIELQTKRGCSREDAMDIYKKERRAMKLKDVDKIKEKYVLCGTSLLSIFQAGNDKEELMRMAKFLNLGDIVVTASRVKARVAKMAEYNRKRQRAYNKKYYQEVTKKKKEQLKNL